MSLSYLIAKLRTYFFKSDAMIHYYRKQGMIIGKKPRIFSDISTPESYLIEIGDNVTISNGVQLITHDASIAKALDGVTDVFGKVKIGNNCFIGAKSIILYGCTLADNTIVAAGSVVTKSVTESGKVIGGNPAKVICDVDTFANKSKKIAVTTKSMTKEQKREFLINNDEILLKR